MNLSVPIYFYNTPEVPLFATPKLSEKVLRREGQCCENEETDLKNRKFLQKFLKHYFLIFTKTFLLFFDIDLLFIPEKVTELLQLYYSDNDIFIQLTPHGIHSLTETVSCSRAID